MISVSQAISKDTGGHYGRYKFITYTVQLYIPHSFHTKIQTEDNVWRAQKGCWRNFEKNEQC